MLYFLGIYFFLRILLSYFQIQAKYIAIISKISYNLEWELSSLLPKYADWVSKGKDKHHFICKVCQTNSLKLCNVKVEELKLHVKGNIKDGGKSKHKRNMYVLKTQSKILLKSNRSSENVVTQI